MSLQGPAKEIAVSMLEDLKSHVSAQHEKQSIFDERLDLGDLDMTSFRADEELGTDIVEPPAAQAGMPQHSCRCTRMALLATSHYQHAVV